MSRHPLEILSWISAVIGLGFVAAELDQAGNDRQVAQTLSFIERFNDESIVKARQEIQSAWLPYAPYYASATGAAGLSREQLDKLSVEIVRADQEDHGGKLLVQILTITSFFDELAICASTGCDLGMVCSYFKSFANDFHSLTSPVLKEMSRGFDTGAVGEGLAKFVDEGRNGICTSGTSRRRRSAG